MAIPEFKEDLNIISGLNDYPGAEDGLSTAQFKAKFDKAGLEIQKYINEVLLPNLNELVDVDALINAIIDNTLTISGKAADAKVTGETFDSVNEVLNNKLSTSGGELTGDLDMSGNYIKNVASPESDSDAATKKFVEDAVKEKMSLDLVWELADSANSMAAGDLTLTNGDYSYYLVEPKGTLPAMICRNGTSWRAQSYLIDGGIMDSPATKKSSVSWYMRTFNFANTKTTKKVTVSDCYNTYNTSSSGWIADGTRVQNGSIVPYRIWGIKGVSV